MRTVLLRSCVVAGMVGALVACAAGTDNELPILGGHDAAVDASQADGSSGVGGSSGGTGGSGGGAGTAGDSGAGGAAGSAGTAGTGAASGSGGTGATAGSGGGGGTGSSGGTGGTGTSGGGTGGAGLDPALGLPDAAGALCEVGSFCFANPLWACRIATPTDGRCETCYLGALCGVQGTACSASDECGTLYQCYDGVCSSICELGVGDSLCDAADCHDVGHATHGVCVPD